MAARKVRAQAAVDHRVQKRAPCGARAGTVLAGA